MSFNSWPFISIIIAVIFATVLVVLWYKYVERRNGRLVFRAPYHSPAPPRCDTREQQEARLQELMDKTKVINTTQAASKGPSMVPLKSQGSIMSLVSLCTGSSTESYNGDDYDGGVFSSNEGLLRGSQFECPICLADCRDDPGIRVLPCGHCFHEDCIRAWFIQQLVKPTCPLCRSPLLPPLSEDTKILLKA
ncbi:hypothetical protein FOL47_000539 [Perkinsus chesapeaki]|uniref:RING-type domain-containing protein n=1 Tax=Perkinsus chesapeaki TaxID=330153 RepID=A0A7J6N1R9_PERCH|nr:hypothetical protein FOL47_000539 [Perkinsus chesapeaki]